MNLEHTLEVIKLAAGGPGSGRHPGFAKLARFAYSPYRRSLYSGIEQVKNKILSGPYGKFVTEIYVHGSFTTNKPHPSDVDVHAFVDGKKMKKEDYDAYEDLHFESKDTFKIGKADVQYSELQIIRPKEFPRLLGWRHNEYTKPKFIKIHG
jgi:hypothetical protein